MLLSLMLVMVAAYVLLVVLLVVVGEASFFPASKALHASRLRGINRALQV